MLGAIARFFVEAFIRCDMALSLISCIQWCNIAPFVDLRCVLWCNIAPYIDPCFTQDVAILRVYIA